jgi:hypothetical protein
MSIPVVLAIAGVILVALGIVGGGITGQFGFPSLPPRDRVLACVGGLLFLVAAYFLDQPRTSPQPEPPVVNVPSTIPLETPVIAEATQAPTQIRNTTPESAIAPQPTPQPPVAPQPATQAPIVLPPTSAPVQPPTPAPSQQLIRDPRNGECPCTGEGPSILEAWGPGDVDYLVRVEANQTYDWGGRGHFWDLSSQEELDNTWVWKVPEHQKIYPTGKEGEIPPGMVIGNKP